MLVEISLLLAVFMLNLSFGHSYYLMCPLHAARESYCNCGQSLYVPMIQSRSVYGSQLNTEILPEQLWIVPAEDYEAEIPAVKIAVLPAQPSSTNQIVQPKLMPDVKISWKLKENDKKSRESVIDIPDEIKSEKLSGDSSFDDKQMSRTSTEGSVMSLSEAADQLASTVMVETTERVSNTIEKSNKDKKTRKLIKKEKVENTGKGRKADPNED